jgi:phenylpropionate dioxygenase-like ring-hydroxylating dioxygenase large terminal subunit
MLVTKQPVLKRFWYPVLPLAQLDDRPYSFTLLGQPIVIWRGLAGTIAVAEDRCCHRSARLSKGSVVNGHLQCAYHGWQYDGSGACVAVPQLGDGTIPASYCIKGFRSAQRYGYIWACLGEPLQGIPEIPEASDPAFRQIHEFYESWGCQGLRVMENEMDMAHPTFVHTTTFGSTTHPLPEKLEVTETDYGIYAQALLGVVNPPEQQQNLKLESPQTFRRLDMEWHMPFTCKLRINYPNGLVHIIVNTATPIDDRTSQIVQFCLRNDTEAETPAMDVIAFDRRVTLEDKAILETTDYDVPLRPSVEQHMLTDQPGIAMRRKLALLLKAHGEVEQTHRQLEA